MRGRFGLFAFVLTVSGLLAGCGRVQEKPRFLWVDALANWMQISFPGVIDHVVDKAKRAGFTGLVVDVKPITGQVMYPSKVAPRLTEWQGAVSPGGYDYVDAFVRLGHEYGLKVYFSVNVFVGGHRRFEKGIVYTDHPEWQCVAYTPEGLVKYTELPNTEAVFLGPSLRAVQEYNLAVLEELVRHYPVDGIVLDRVYYPDLRCDFGEASKQAFERFLGHKVRVWPEAVYRYEDGKRVPGPLYRDWLKFRTKVLHDFLVDARRTVKQVNPSVDFCLYTGAWYPQTVQTGLNWATTNSPVNRLWPDSSFRRWAVADLFDALFVGLYYSALSPDELPAAIPDSARGWYAIESAADSVRIVVGPDKPVYGGLLLRYFRREPVRLQQAVQTCLKSLDGVMLFDLVYVEKYYFWDEVEAALRGTKE